MAEILYSDKSIAVAIKPAGVLSTDEPGGMPDLLKESLGRVRTVHRLDRVVSGLMVFARTANVASELSRQMREDEFHKRYIAVVHGCPQEKQGRFTDLLFRESKERKTYVVQEQAKGVQEAILDYKVLGCRQGMSLVSISLITGRTHQIRAQFSARSLPLVGDRKYSTIPDDCDIALFSSYLSFIHPFSRERVEFSAPAPDTWPWNIFKEDANG